MASGRPRSAIGGGGTQSEDPGAGSKRGSLNHREAGERRVSENRGAKPRLSLRALPGPKEDADRERYPDKEAKRLADAPSGPARRPSPPEADRAGPAGGVVTRSYRRAERGRARRRQRAAHPPANGRRGSRGTFSVRRNVNDPSAGSPTETLLRLLLPLNDQV